MITLPIKPLSVNKAWQGRRYKTKEYKAYEKACLLAMKRITPPEGKFALFIEFGFSNKNSDLTNPVKLIEDIICKKYSINDNKNYCTLLIKKVVPKGREYIKFKIEPLDEANLNLEFLE